MSGRVAGYDSPAGLGVIVADDGTEYHFQCVGIADGSREIAPGTTVRFAPLARLGRVEATAIEPVGAPGTPPSTVAP